MSTLTLPGTIPGLLRRGSPVTLRPRVYGDVTLMHGGQGVVHDAARGVAVVDTFGGSTRVVRYGREDLALDLTDPTGRAHAAWWLANQPGNESVVSRRRESPRWTCCPGASNDPGDRLWHLTSYGCAPYRDAFEGEHDPRVVVPALAALNPDDPRLLPDGSRWVDAEALRLVCLHVAGVSA